MKYLKDHQVEEAAEALQNLKMSKKTMCSLLITKTLGRSGISHIHIKFTL